jgi:hypothetical protein
VWESSEAPICRGGELALPASIHPFVIIRHHHIWLLLVREAARELLHWFQGLLQQSQCSNDTVSVNGDNHTASLATSSIATVPRLSLLVHDTAAMAPSMSLPRNPWFPQLSGFPHNQASGSHHNLCTARLLLLLLGGRPLVVCATRAQRHVQRLR